MSRETDGAEGAEALAESEPHRGPAAPHTDGSGAADTMPESDTFCGRTDPSDNGRGGADPSTSDGASAVKVREKRRESDGSYAPYHRFAPHTRRLRYYARWWIRWRGELQALRQQAGYDVPDVDIEDVQRLKARWGRRAKKQLIEQHPLGPWLDDLPGLAGPTTAYLVGIIGDPWRFPGQPCEAIRSGDADHGWRARPMMDVGDPCPMDVPDPNDPYEACGAPLTEPRRGTGVRAVWSYFGLTPGSRKSKGASAGYRTRCKGLILAPDTGLAAQIVRQRPEPYRSRYEDEKARLKRERGYRSDGERVEPVDLLPESDAERGELPPLIYLDKVARTIAVKQFIGDLLMTWKDVQPRGSY